MVASGIKKLRTRRKEMTHARPDVGTEERPQRQRLKPKPSSSGGRGCKSGFSAVIVLVIEQVTEQVAHVLDWHTAAML